MNDTSAVLSGREKWPVTWTAVLTAIAALLLFIVVRAHEPWADESQAWLLVRDLSLSDLLFHYLRYEGHPSLWYLILYLPVKADLPYPWINLISWLAAVAGIWIFLRHAPFPFYLKILLPFTYFIFYQYGVIARNYALIPVLLWIVAVLYRKRMAHPVAFTTMLILLANTSLHGTVLAISLALFYLYDTIGSWNNLSPHDRKRTVATLGVFGLSLILLWLQLRWPNGLVYTVGTVAKEPLFIINTSLTAIPWLSLMIWGALMVWLARQQVLLLYTISLAGLLILLSRVCKLWHEGMLFLLLVWVLWLAFDRYHDRTTGKEETFSDRIFRVFAQAGMGIMLAVHVIWSVYACRFDLHHPYSGAPACAAYLKTHQLDTGGLFMVGFNGIGVLPYFDANIFSNYNQGKDFCFWWWSTDNPRVRYHLEPELFGYLDWIAEEKPDMILFGLNEPRSERLLIRLLEAGDYEVTQTFPGETRWKGQPFEWDTLLLMKRTTE